MFGTLGGPEIFLILVIALIVFGPRRLPEIGKTMGRMLAEFRKASNEFKRTLEEEVETEKLRAPASAAAAPTDPVSVVEPGSSAPPVGAETAGAATEASGATDTPSETPHPTWDQPAADAAGEPGTVSRPDARPIEPR